MGSGGKVCRVYFFSSSFVRKSYTTDSAQCVIFYNKTSQIFLVLEQTLPTLLKKAAGMGDCGMLYLSSQKLFHD